MTSGSDGAGLRVSEVHAQDTTNFALTLRAYLDDRLRLDLGYDPALFDAATVERMSRHLTMLLAGIAADPDRPVRDLDMLSVAERDELLVRRNDTAHPVPAATVPDLFAEQVRRTPHAIAVCCDGAELSYAELDRRANLLAHELIRLGVRPEDRVGILAERSVGLVVAVLAIGKAGGAYLPLDQRAAGRPDADGARPGRLPCAAHRPRVAGHRRRNPHAPARRARRPGAGCRSGHPHRAC